MRAKIKIDLCISQMSHQEILGISKLTLKKLYHDFTSSLPPLALLIFGIVEEKYGNTGKGKSYT